MRGDRSFDPMVPLLAMALQDEVFEHVAAVQELYPVFQDAVRTYGNSLPLLVKANKMKTLVLRDFEDDALLCDEKGWTYTSAAAERQTKDNNDEDDLRQAKPAGKRRVPGQHREKDVEHRDGEKGPKEDGRDTGDSRAEFVSDCGGKTHEECVAGDAGGVSGAPVLKSSKKKTKGGK
ncbi:hypothetical protein HDU86_006955 [Geranomyces michiganensis]|nr:hypothetical protein HDU86_006955 [Geranomyces michiganensis]